MSEAFVHDAKNVQIRCGDFVQNFAGKIRRVVDIRTIDNRIKLRCNEQEQFLTTFVRAEQYHFVDSDSVYIDDEGEYVYSKERNDYHVGNKSPANINYALDRNGQRIFEGDHVVDLGGVDWFVAEIIAPDQVAIIDGKRLRQNSFVTCLSNVELKVVDPMPTPYVVGHNGERIQLGDRVSPYYNNDVFVTVVRINVEENLLRYRIPDGKESKSRTATDYVLHVPSLEDEQPANIEFAEGLAYDMHGEVLASGDVVEMNWWSKKVLPVLVLGVLDTNFMRVRSANSDEFVVDSRITKYSSDMNQRNTLVKGYETRDVDRYTLTVGDRVRRLDGNGQPFGSPYLVVAIQTSPIERIVLQSRNGEIFPNVQPDRCRLYPLVDPPHEPDEHEPIVPTADNQAAEIEHTKDRVPRSIAEVYGRAFFLWETFCWKFGASDGLSKVISCLTWGLDAFGIQTFQSEIDYVTSRWLETAQRRGNYGQLPFYEAIEAHVVVNATKAKKYFCLECEALKVIPDNLLLCPNCTNRLRDKDRQRLEWFVRNRNIFVHSFDHDFVFGYLWQAEELNINTTPNGFTTEEPDEDDE